jgi:hypothetical protein
MMDTSPPADEQEHRVDSTDGLDDGPHRAVVDRIEGALAVLLVGEQEHEVHLSVADLPEGAAAGAWVHLEMAEGTVTCTARDEAGEAEARQRVDDRLDRIRRNQRGGRFGR